MRKTMRKVMIVVPVLMTGRHVSLKSKIGPVMAQIAATAAARIKIAGLPQKSEAWRAKRPNQSARWDTRFFAGFVLSFVMYKQVIALQCVPLLRKFFHSQGSEQHVQSGGRSVKTWPAKPRYKG